MKYKLKIDGIKYTTPEVIKRAADSVNGAIAGSGLVALASGYPKFALGLGLFMGVVKGVSNFFSDSKK